MIDFFLSLDPTLKVFWGIALASSVVFLIQTVLTFVGLDADTSDGAGFDDVEAEGVSGFFTFKNLINFLLGYSWSGIALYNHIISSLWLQALAIGVGLLFVLVFVVILRQVLKLSTDKTFHIKETVGLVADVYLRIPAAKTGTGKVLVSVRGSVHELEAMTEDSEIPTGRKVKIVADLGAEVVLVTLI